MYLNQNLSVVVVPVNQSKPVTYHSGSRRVFHPWFPPPFTVREPNSTPIPLASFVMPISRTTTCSCTRHKYKKCGKRKPPTPFGFPWSCRHFPAQVRGNWWGWGVGPPYTLWFLL